MDAVKNFLHSNDKNSSTEVCTETAAPVIQENINKHEHVETAEAIDREKHIHHHQTRVQPVADKQVLETEHEHQVLPEVTRERVEEIAPEHKQKLHALHNEHKDQRTVGETVRTQEHLGTSVNEHVHHHVHEHITPVIQRETHANKTVHTTIPVHEKIHEAPIVHESTILPTIGMDQFKEKLSGHDHKHGEESHNHKFFGGEPKVAGTQNTSATGTIHDSAVPHSH